MNPDANQTNDQREMRPKAKPTKEHVHPFHLHHLPPLLSGEEARSLDRLAQRGAGIDAFTLMEVAGSHAALWIRSLVFGAMEDLETARTSVHQHHGPRHLCFLCGKGNNAGDALVAARYLLRDPRVVLSVFLAEGEQDLTPDTRRNLDLLRDYDAPEESFEDRKSRTVEDADQDDAFISSRIAWLRDLTVFTELPDHDPDRPRLPLPDLFVDALLGSGLRGNVREPIAGIIEQVNLLRARHDIETVAMDIASGLDATTGRIRGTSIEADATLSFGGFKQGFYLNQGPGLSGSCVSVELPFPFHMREPSTFLFGPEFRELIPRIQRPSASHKYDGGVVHVIAGSPGLVGAAVMSARAAWAKGAGAVFLLCPAGILPALEEQAPEIIKKPIGASTDTHFTPHHLPEILRHLSARPGALLIGPGLGERVHGNGFVRDLLTMLAESYSGRENGRSKPPTPVVLDADALRGWRLSELGEWAAKASGPGGGAGRGPAPSLTGTGKQAGGSSDSWTTPQMPFPIVLTPHTGEAVSLLGLDSVFESDEQRLLAIRQAAQTSGLWICSKGMPTCLATPQGTLGVSSYETAPFNRAGFGDVLSGQIAANLAFLHGFERHAADSAKTGKRTTQRDRAAQAVTRNNPQYPDHAVLDALVHGAEQVERQERTHPDRPISPEDIL